MESKRQKQVAETVKRNIGPLLQQEGPYIYGNDVLVTVTAVKMSPDMSIAKIYLSIYNTENKQAVLLQIEDQYFRLKQSFAHRVRKHLRRTPDLQFFMDETLDEMYRLNDLFNRLEKENQLGRSEEE